MTKENQNYAFYSRVLNKPFDSVQELKLAEEAHYAKLKAKEDKAAAKKADALKVEEAFKALNKARKEYKGNLLKVTDNYQKGLKDLKDLFDSERAEIEATLAEAEATYSKALKDFTNKYPEGYHLTLKDGDFETTIKGSTSAKSDIDTPSTLKDLFDLIFNI